MRALIVVDMLNDFIHPDGTAYMGDMSRGIIPFVVNKIKEFDKNGEPVYFVNDAHEMDDRSFKIFPPHCLYGTWGAELIDEIKELNINTFTSTVQKLEYDGFVNTAFDVILCSYRPKIKEVHFVGVCTSICVMETLSTAYYLEYDPVIYEEGCADITWEDHNYGLDRMEKLFGAKII
jgi:nicotinamidase/pyrazinamidase